MRGFILTLFMIICAASSFAQTQTAKRTPSGRGYLEYVPADYATSSTLYPCIVFLHGAGERGDGSPAALEKVKSHGVPKFIKNGSTMCFTVNGKTECFIVLSPQQSTSRWSWTGDALPFMKWALANYRIDPNRLYLTGLSMGGGWDTASDPQNDPNIIAAFAPVSTTGDYKASARIAANKIPVWAFHGEKDTAFTLFQGKSPVNGMTSVGANPSPIWTIVPGGTHSDNTWDKVYSPTHTYYSPNVYEWFLTQKKTASNVAPVANAGPDKTITLPTNTTVLAGSGSGQITSYTWKQLSGPTTATTSAINNANLTVSNCVEGKYTFMLTVIDANNKTATDNVSIKVMPVINQLLTANAGTDKLVTLPTNTATLSGLASYSSGQIVDYSWKQLSGPTSSTTSPLNNAEITVSNCVQGKYTFSLTVTDNNNLTAVDSASITIVNNVNQAPIVNAGSDKWLILPTKSFTLNAVATDVDGSIVSYQWIKTWGPDISITNMNTQSVSITASAAGTYTFKIIVTDNKGLKASDLINVTIRNAPPVVNAGADQQLTLPTTQTTLKGLATDDDGSIIRYAWTQTNGPTAIINNATLSTIQVSQLTTVGQYVFKLVVTDNDNQTAADYVTINVSKQATTQTSSARSFAIETEEVQDEESSFNTGLNQNYPNPFSGSTTIPFSIKSKQHIVIKVYDFYGVEIETLVNEELEAGEHSVFFSPSTQNTLYHIKLIADGKMFVVKAIQL